MKEKLRLGIYGGTFSPPHNGHVNSAKDFVREMKLDKLLIIPDNLPPHKEFAGGATTDDRLEMSRLAFLGLDKCEISELEIRRGGRSYTYQTLEELASTECDLYFLCGTDMFTTLEHWYRPDIICSLATIVLAKRDSDNDEEIERANKTLKTKFGANTIVLTHTPKVLSSSLVREKIANGEDVSSLVPPSVLDYINQNGLYKKI